MKRLLTVLRVVVGLALIVFLFSRIDLRGVIHNISRANIGLVGLAAIPYAIFILISALRWKILLDYKGMGLGLAEVLKIYFIHLFLNNFLPSNVGGDVARVALTMKEGKRADALASVVVDRVLGFLGLFVFGFFSVFLLYLVVHRVEFLSFLIVGSVILVLISIVIFSERIYKRLAPLLLRVKVLHAGERLVRLYETTVHFGKARRAMLACIIMSFFIQALLAIGPYILLNALPVEQDVSPLVFFIYLPIVNVISMIPVSVGGIGVRENSYAFLFRRAGLPAEAAVSVSLLSFLMTFIFSLPGGFLYFFYRRTPAAKALGVDKHG